MKQIAKDLCNSLKNEPWRWRMGYCTIDRDDGFAIWTANVAIANTHLYRPYEAGLGFLGSFAVYFALRRWRNSMPLLGYATGDA